MLRVGLVEGLEEGRGVGIPVGRGRKEKERKKSFVNSERMRWYRIPQTHRLCGISSLIRCDLM